MKYHEYANIFPMMSEAEIKTLANDIRSRGLNEPIMVCQGKILDGRNRWLACKQARVKPHTVQFEGRDPLSYVLSCNLHRRHLNESQRAMVGAHVANMRHGGNRRTIQKVNLPLETTTIPQAAVKLNVSPKSIQHARKVQTKAVPEVVKAVEQGRMSVSHAAKVADQPKAAQRKVAMAAWTSPSAHVSHNTGDNEWYTPREIIESTRIVLGGISLDPASSNDANAVIKAKRIFTESDNGLVKKWKAPSVFMNPPYASHLIGKFCEKLLQELENGNTKSAVVLVNNATETKWFQSIAEKSQAVCFPLGRVKFWHPRKVSTPLQGQAILYYGQSKTTFKREFKQYGKVWL